VRPSCSSRTIRANIEAMAVTIYTTATCVYCRAAKKLFSEHNIAYTEKDVAQDAAARSEMIERSGQLGVPVIDVNGTVVVGFNEPKLRELLDIRG